MSFLAVKVALLLKKSSGLKSRCSPSESGYFVIIVIFGF